MYLMQYTCHLAQICQSTWSVLICESAPLTDYNNDSWKRYYVPKIVLPEQKIWNHLHLLFKRFSFDDRQYKHLNGRLVAVCALLTCFRPARWFFYAELNSGLPETGKPCEKWTQRDQLKQWNKLQWCKFANPVEHSRFPGKRELVWPGVLVWLRNLSPFLQRRASWSLLEEANPHLLLEALKNLDQLACFVEKL